jgi:gliding motility-associated-like protein
VFTFLDSTTAQTYADTGLVNGKIYCYKIISIGQYSDTTLPRPLYNKSQIKCDIPIDIIPPCQPTLTMNNDCERITNLLSWTNPNTYCSNDGMKYYIYFAFTNDASLQRIDSILNINTITYSHEFLFEGIPSVAGCYAVTAIDSTGNESPIVTKQCVDNCPIYELPNVFTPNGDDINDLFKPLLPYRYVKNIDIKIYNRWGTIMFETTDTNILWDGRNSSNKKMCPDGTYFYICIVNEIHVEGITPRVLRGFIQLFSEKTKANN